MGGRPTKFEARTANSTALLGRICTKERRLGLATAELKMVSNFSDLLSKLLDFDPSKRMTAAAALRHGFFTELDAPKTDQSQLQTGNNNARAAQQKHLVQNRFKSTIPYR
jgi:serine/threonine protein kinase